MRNRRKQKFHMVQLMETSKQDGLEKVQHPKLRNKELLNVFNRLADGQDDQRKTCIEGMIKFLTDQEKSSTEARIPIINFL